MLRARRGDGMRARVMLIPIVLAGLAGAAPAASQLEVTMYRSWLPPNVTVVHGLFRVDGAMLGTGQECNYTIRLAVVDSVGTRLVNNEWEGHCPPPRDGMATGALETFEFAVLPARYTVEITVQGADTERRRLVASVPLHSLPDVSLASDLILARRAGWIDSTSTAQWTIRKGQLGIAAASEAVAEEARPQMAYYLEVYPAPGQPMNGKLIGLIRRLDGKQLARLELATLDAVEEARPLAGNVSLAGLAPGDYVMETQLELRDTVIVRAHAFRMEGRIAQQDVPGAVSGYFATLSDAELQRLFDPVLVTLRRQADRQLFEGLNPDGRRRFLHQYFGGVEPTPEGRGENALDMYLERVEHVSSQFTERRGGLEGWRTDRGRVWLIRGEPPSRVSRPLPPGGAAPYEIWFFPVPSRYAYVFVDEARIGSYRLAYTTDPDEQSVPDWDRRVGADAIEEMVRLGIPVPSSVRIIRNLQPGATDHK
ncbi:MAG: GWxTD domain-containing protein [Gemmatimonadetes bacterium]|nr:GWxTD domain-containing protein [Gemmatimonadota bacterium]